MTLLNKNLAIMVVSLPPTLLDKINTEVKRRKVSSIANQSRSSIIREYIEKGLNHDETPTKVSYKKGRFYH